MSDSPLNNPPRPPPPQLSNITRRFHSHRNMGLNKPIPSDANIPPVIGEHCYYHSPKTDFIHNDTTSYICKIRLESGDIIKPAVHYSLPENHGSVPFITYHGTLESIELVLGNY